MSLGYAVITTSASSSRRFLLKKSLEELRCRAALRWIFYAMKVISKPICYRGHLRRLSMLSAFDRAYQPPLPWLIGVQAKVRPRECLSHRAGGCRTPDSGIGAGLETSYPQRRHLFTPLTVTPCPVMSVFLGGGWHLCTRSRASGKTAVVL